MSKTVDQIDSLIKEIDDISVHYMTDENKKLKSSLEKLKKTAKQELKESRIFESPDHYNGSLEWELGQFKSVVNGLTREEWNAVERGEAVSKYDVALANLTKTFEDFLDFWWHVAYKPNKKTFETVKQYASIAQDEWKAYDEIISLTGKYSLDNKTFNNRFNKMGKQDGLWAAIELDDYAQVTGILSKILKK